MVIKSLSASRLNMYMRCPRQFYYKYVLGKDEAPPNAPLIIGQSFHAGIEHNYKQKRETHKDLPISEVLEVFAAKFDSLALDDIGEDKGKAKDQGIEVTKIYSTQIVPTIQPVDVEREFRVQVRLRKTDDELTLDYAECKSKAEREAVDLYKYWWFEGVIDVYDDKDMIIDMKTTGRNVKAPKPEHLLQVGGYAWGYKEERKKQGLPQDNISARVDYAVRKAKAPEVAVFDIKQLDTNIALFVNVLGNVAKGIECDVFTPNRPHVMCSHRWCGFAELCEGDCGGTVKE